LDFSTILSLIEEDYNNNNSNNLNNKSSRSSRTLLGCGCYIPVYVFIAPGFMFYVLSLKWRLFNVSIACIKTIYVPRWTSASFSLFDFQHTFYITWNISRIPQLWILIACEHLREYCCLNNSPPHDVNGLNWPALFFNNTGRDNFFFILMWK